VTVDVHVAAALGARALGAPSPECSDRERSQPANEASDRVLLQVHVTDSDALIALESLADGPGESVLAFLRRSQRRVLAYCLQVTLKAQLRQLAGGTTPREVIDKFKTMQMVDVQLPTTDGRELTLSRYTQPAPEHRMLLEQLRLDLPSQPPPRITAAQAAQKVAALAV